MQQLVDSFIDSFRKAVHREMDAMRERLGPFEVPLAAGEAVDAANGDKERAYRFRVSKPNDKLVLHAECTLRHEGGEHLVTVTALGGNSVTVSTDAKVNLGHSWYTLVIYPWFLYEELLEVLESLLDSPDDALRLAFALFGRSESRCEARSLLAAHPELNASQTRAVQLCADSELAFVWGPPGTGKTHTLGHIITELLAQGQRILVTSTTNAAVDQALAKLAGIPEAQPFLNDGRVVRIGHGQGARTYGASLGEVVARVHANVREKLDRLSERLRQVNVQLPACDELIQRLDDQAAPLQDDLFETIRDETLRESDLTPLFPARRVTDILAMPAPEKRRWLVRKRKRLESVARLAKERISALNRELRSSERGVVRDARVVLSTMTNVYISRLMEGLRFDAVIVEEAGMAVLPTLFYCASLATRKAIMVGDPKQLPPVVQSRNRFVHKAMGRSIFEVTVPDPHRSELVVMLDTQYRMHPAIGSLVSDLFYDGKLAHGECTAEREAIAAREPFPGHPMVLVDTCGISRCAARDGTFSRHNEATAQQCVDLAAKAVRAGIETVAVITPYVEQARLIAKLLKAARIPRDRVECQTVHRFQGNERDLVILDTVDTAPMRPGVLLAGDAPGKPSRNLLNVSVSRARGKLILIADAAYFRRHASRSVINRLIGAIAERGETRRGR